MIQKRPDDSFAIGFAYTGISDQVHGFDIDSGFPLRAITRRCLRSATPCSLPPAGPFSRTSSTSGSREAMCRTKMAGPWRMQLCLGHVPPSLSDEAGSDEGRLHSHRYQYRCRVVRAQTGAPPKPILSRRSSLIATVALGAGLPLLLRRRESYGVGADAAYDR